MADPHSKQPRERFSGVLKSLEDPIAEPDELIVVGKPPDGGLTAWLQVLGVHITMFNILGNINCYLESQSYYVETLGASPSAISWVRYVHSFGLLFVGISTSRGPDPSHFRYRYAAGTFLLLLGVFTAPLATTYWQLFLSQGICVGIANGLLSCNAFGLISTYFDKNENFAIWLALSGSALGKVIPPFVIEKLLPRIGFAWAVRVVGLIAAITMLGSNLILKPRKVGREVNHVMSRLGYRCCCCCYFCCVVASRCSCRSLGLYFGFFSLCSYSQDTLQLDQQTSFDNLITMSSVCSFGHFMPVLAVTRADVLTGPDHDYGQIIAWACFCGFFAAGIQNPSPSTLGSLTTDLGKLEL
ncbi:major facilitator superfamily domain-containing protein [Tuber brumale]|nr:major facilitator superfamily domain-containing protein [Tuber brumale]